MAICGHQFHGGDESDWVLSTSAGCLTGSTTASRILQELFKKHCRKTQDEMPRKRPKIVIASSENIVQTKQKTHEAKDSSSLKEKNEDLIVKKITGTYSFDNFDESQHLNGCPMKWLYQKKLLEKDKVFKVRRPCNNKSVAKKEVKKERNKSLRDKTPIEVKIHKINLIEKYSNNWEGVFPPYASIPLEKSKDLETHRKKLAAKLNWKLHDDTQEDYSFETSSEVSSRLNYLPPRPLLGLKPLLSVLLSPNEKTNCCTLAALPNASSRKTKIKPSLSIQSLDLSFTPPNSKPKMTNTLRWGSKASIHAKKLQIPSPITINLEEKNKKSPPNSNNQLKILHKTSPVKKFSERTNQVKSLSALFYELQGKTDFRNQNEKYFEEMIRDLSLEEGQFKIKRFLNISSANSDPVQGCQLNSEKRKKFMRAASKNSESNLMCAKIRFFEKKPSSKRTAKGGPIDSFSDLVITSG